MKKIVFILLLFSFFGCKKDRLKNEKEIFIGEWKWIYTESTGDFCSGNPVTTTIKTPANFGADFKVEFIKKGKVSFYKNSQFLSEKRIVFSSFQEENSWLRNSFSFVIYLDNDEDSTLFGEINQDTIVFGNYFPFDGNPCTTHRNFFIRN